MTILPENIFLLSSFELKIIAAIGGLRRILCFLDEDNHPQGQDELASSLLSLTNKGLIFEEFGKLTLCSEVQMIIDVMKSARAGLVLTSGNAGVPRMCCYLYRGQSVVIVPRSYIRDCFGLFLANESDLLSFLDDGGWFPETHYGGGGADTELSESIPDEIEQILHCGKQLDSAPTDEKIVLIAESFSLSSGRCFEKRIIYASTVRLMTATSSGEPKVFPFETDEMKAWIRQLSKGETSFDIC